MSALVQKKMALEKFEYPATGGVTNSFLPSRNPSYSGTGDALDEGIIQEQSSGLKAYNYAEGIEIKTLRRRYDNMTTAERASYEAFRAAVGGDLFKFTDHAGAAHTVMFAGFQREFTAQRGDRWAFEITMREEL